MTPANTAAAAPTLPHWESTPEDLPAAIREIKRALRARIDASGRSVDEVFSVIEARVRTQVEDILAVKERGETVWPVIDYADIAAGTVTAEQLASLRRRGCLIVRGHFDREQALGWDRPSDFPDENYERDWTNRFHIDDLNATGRRGLGLN